MDKNLTDQQFELLQRHLEFSGKVIDAALAQIKRQNQPAHAATMTALHAGGMMSLRTTFSPDGLAIAAIELIAPNGQAIALATLDLELQDFPSSN